MTENPTNDVVEEVDAEVVDAAPATSPGTSLVVPDTGELISLEADTDILARAVVELTERISKIKDQVLSPIDRELLRRIDRRHKYTIRTDLADDTQYELKTTSPTAGTEAYDGLKLDDELAALIAADLVDEEAAGEALKRTITVTFRIPHYRPGPDGVPERVDVDALAERLKQTPRIADVPVEVLDAKVGRSPHLPGVTRLRKGPDCGEALDRAKLEVPAPKRTVKVKKLTIQAAKAA